MTTRTITIVHTISENDLPARDGAENRRAWVVPLDTEAAFDGLKIRGAEPSALGAQVSIYLGNALQFSDRVETCLAAGGRLFGDSPGNETPMPLLCTRTDRVEIEAPLGTDLQLFGRVTA